MRHRTWPHLLQGTCVAVQAPGGSGRTLAFLPPGLAKVLATAPPAWPCMLVLVHSRCVCSLPGLPPMHPALLGSVVLQTVV